MQIRYIIVHLALITASTIQTRFERSISLGRWAKVKSILEKYDWNQLDPSYNDDLALRTATTHYREDVIRMLLQDSRVNPLPTHTQPVSALDIALNVGNPKVIRAFMEDGRVPGSSAYFEGNPRFTAIPEDLMIASSYLINYSTSFEAFKYHQFKAVDFELLLKRSSRNKVKRKAILQCFFSRIGLEMKCARSIIDIFTNYDICDIRRLNRKSMKAFYLYRIFDNLPTEVISRIVSFDMKHEDSEPMTAARFVKRFLGELILTALFSTFILSVINPVYSIINLVLVFGVIAVTKSY